jgi:hypothetical protein
MQSCWLRFTPWWLMSTTADKVTTILWFLALLWKQRGQVAELAQLGLQLQTPSCFLSSPITAPFLVPSAPLPKSWLAFFLSFTLGKQGLLRCKGWKVLLWLELARAVRGDGFWGMHLYYSLASPGVGSPSLSHSTELFFFFLLKEYKALSKTTKSNHALLPDPRWITGTAKFDNHYSNSQGSADCNSGVRSGQLLIFITQNLLEQSHVFVDCW